MISLNIEAFIEYIESYFETFAKYIVVLSAL